jgi:PAS domain S-box-containing protein
LKQGGKGLVYREAIFLTTGEYWGIVSTVIDADSLFSTLVARGNELGVRLKIRDLESNNLLLSSTPGSAEIKSEIALNLPGRQWELIGGADSRINTHWVLMRVLGWILAFVITFLWVRYLLSNREKEFAQQLLRESQTRLRRAFSASSQGMALVNQQGDWLDVNQSMTSMLGMTADALKKMPVPSIFTAEEYQRVEGIMEEISRQDNEHVHFQQFEAMLCSGRMGLVSLGICYKTPTETHWIVQIIDISERIRLDKLKREFVSVVSHELRTPLTSISAGIKLLASGKIGHFEPAADKIIQIALQNSDRLSLLINDLLDMEKLVAGKMLVDMKPQNIKAITAAAVESVQNNAAQKNLNLVSQFPEETVWVTGDELRLTQIIVNLLSNAIKFSSSDTDIELSIHLDKEEVHIAIRDHGPGIATENQNRLFKQFSQLDTSDTRNQTGTGLGLAISKELVGLMGGSIGVSSQPGSGATFYFILPRLRQ